MESLGQGRQLNKLSLFDLKQSLTAFAAIMGIPANNMPSNEVMIVTIEALIRNFGAMHEGEVRKAFEMAATGQLEVEEHYQSFSLKYLCSVLNAYRVKVNITMRHYDRISKEPEPIAFEGQVDWTDIVQHLIEASKTQDPRSLIIPVQVYDWLVQNGSIVLTVEDKKNAMTSAENELKQELLDKLMSHTLTGQERQWNEMMKTSSYKKGDRLHDRLALMAKKIIVRKYLKSKHEI